MGEREAIDRSLPDLTQVVADQLAPAGWVVRLQGRELPGSGTLTRATQAGVMATAQLGVGIRIPDDWPVQLRLRLGVGFEQALGLSVLLTTVPILAVVPHPVTAEHGGMRFELSGEAGITALAEQIVAVIDRHAVAFAERFPNVESLLDETTTGAGVDDRGDPTGAARLAGKQLSVRDLTLLAAAGHRDQVTALLTAFEAARAGKRTAHRRFIRQLHRWLDAGGPPIPPAEQTLARLPLRADQASPSWSQARERFGSARAARGAIQDNARGKSADELRDALQGEYTRQGLEPRPADVADLAERLHAQQRPLGHTRHRIHELRNGISAGLKIIDFLRHGGESKHLNKALNTLSQLDPEWLRPPDRAGYPVAPKGTADTTAVVLDAGTDDLLATVAAAAPRRIGDDTFVDLWFSQDNATGDYPAVVAVHIGCHRVGTVATDRATAFEAIFNAAAFFDEDPLAPGTLRRQGNRAWYLDFRLGRTPKPSTQTDQTAAG